MNSFLTPFSKIGCTTRARRALVLHAILEEGGVYRAALAALYVPLAPWIAGDMCAALAVV